MVTTFTKIIAFFALMIIAVASKAVASPEYDRVYQLESVSWLKSSDNLDDIFAEFLDQEYAKYFELHSRFLVKKIAPINEILGKSAVPYSTLIEKPEVLKKIAQKFLVESLIRTKVYKESETYRFVLEWVYAPRGTVLSTYEFRFVDPGKEAGLRNSELPAAIQNALDLLIGKLPFRGQVTGIEGQMITVNIGKNQNVKPHEILVIETLQGVKIHPKLNTIEEWKWVPVGRAQVEQVEDSISFAKILDTEEGKSIIRFQKVKDVLPAPPEPKKSADGGDEKDLPRLGWFSGGLGLGIYSREAGSSAARYGGSGISETMDLDGLLWFNSRFLAQASAHAALISYSPKDLVANTNVNTSFSGTFTQLRLAMGYSLFPANTIFDTIGWVHFGYKNSNYALSPDSTYLTGGSSFDSLFIGIGGELPFRNLITIQMNLDLGLINTAICRSPAYGDPSSASDLMFQLAGVYHLKDQWNLRVGIKLNSQTMDFSTGESITQKVLSVGPSLLYYF